MVGILDGLKGEQIKLLRRNSISMDINVWGPKAGLISQAKELFFFQRGVMHEESTGISRAADHVRLHMPRYPHDTAHVYLIPGTHVSYVCPDAKKKLE